MVHNLAEMLLIASMTTANFEVANSNVKLHYISHSNLAIGTNNN